MAAPKISGIYKIASKCNNRLYIGSSDDIKRRWNMHKSALKKNKHHSIILQNHYNKYGKEDMILVIIEPCLPEFLIIREQYYINKLNPYFNIRKIAESNRGITRREETKKKIREANLGKTISIETREKQRKRMMGNSYTKGMVPVNAKEVIDITTGIYFESLAEAAKCYNIKRTTLGAMLSGQNKNRTNLIYL